MKTTIIMLVIILSLTVAADSWGQKQAVNNDLISIDVTKSYSSNKKLILQDFMDVEYIALETNDEFVNQGVVMDVGKKYIVVKNRINDGNIFIYDRSGKALRRINHKGHGAEEYTYTLYIILDEDSKEMFVYDHSAKRFLVYDLSGKFKRSFKHRESGNVPFYTNIFNYDKDNLICYDSSNEVSRAFVLISKKDGSITKEFKIPFSGKHISLNLSTAGPITKSGSQYVGQMSVATPDLNPIMPFKDNWTLVEYSSDTVYTFSPGDYNLRPFIVRTPPVQSMEPKVLLQLNLFTDRYYFMESVKFVYDWSTRTGFPGTPIVYDRQEKTFSGYTVYNGDYSTPKEVVMDHLRLIGQEIVSQRFEAFDLVEAYEKKQLKGKLKEIAAKLDEEDNPVIMLAKYKK